MSRSKVLLLASFLAAGPALAGGPGVLKFDEVSFEVAETAGVAVIRVERSQGESGAASVSYATSDGTATAGSDYTSVSGTLSWGSGDGLTKTFTVPISNDSVPEGSETIALTLSNASGASIDATRGTSTLVILG
ncbi:MAG TPA: Calx-beta domain-containing protein, partial [Thermoanaerobaculia bacterium]|nr:Calx-beta domain-containing protein [Thermoanaerobaculia bacterium]